MGNQKSPSSSVIQGVSHIKDHNINEHVTTMKHMVFTAETVTELVLGLEYIFEMFPEEISYDEILYLRNYAKVLKDKGTDYLEEYEVVSQMITDQQRKLADKKLFDEINHLLTL